MKKCTRCGNEFEESEFPIINKRINKRSSMCLACGRDYDREYHAKNKKHRNKLKRKTRSTAINRNRRFIYDYLAINPCVDCGEDDPIVLEFDHQRDKKFIIADAMRGSYSIERIKSEIEKCEVVCANCHRRRTAKTFNWYKYTMTS